MGAGQSLKEQSRRRTHWVESRRRIEFGSGRELQEEVNTHANMDARESDQRRPGSMGEEAAKRRLSRVSESWLEESVCQEGPKRLGE